MSPEVAQVEIDHLKRSHQELRTDIQELTKTVNRLNEQLLEIRYGRKWLFGMLSASAVAGALVDTVLRAFRVY